MQATCLNKGKGVFGAYSQHDFLRKGAERVKSHLQELNVETHIALYTPIDLKNDIRQGKYRQ